MTVDAEAVCTIVEPLYGTTEHIRYVDSGDGEAQLYVVHHYAKGEPRGGVVLCGSIGAERERSLRSIVDVARTVAAEGFDAIRFDYRGIGESTGRFEQHCLSDWQSDIAICAALLRDRIPARPIGLWGIRAGALLASELFVGGLGDAAMFCAPMDGTSLLLDMMRRALVADMVARPSAGRTTREEIVASLEREEFVNIDGYPWSGRLWKDAASHRLMIPNSESRPWILVDFSGLPKTVMGSVGDVHRQVDTGGRFWDSSPLLVPRAPSLTQRTLKWLDSMAAVRGR